MFRKDSFLGELAINIADFEDGEKHNKWYKLANEPAKKKKDPVEGEIHLEMYFTPAPDKDQPASEADNTKDKSKKDAKATKKKEPAKIEDSYKLGKEIGRFFYIFSKLNHLVVPFLLSGKEFERLPAKNTLSSVFLKN